VEVYFNDKFLLNVSQTCGVLRGANFTNFLKKRLLNVGFS